MILSDYLEKKLLDHLLVNTAFSPPATLYFGLFTADPGESGVVSEFAIGTGAYARAVVANNNTNFPLCSATGTPTKSNGARISWPTATTAWGTATHWAVYDATSAGNMLAHGALATPRAIAIGDPPKFASGAFNITAENSAAGGLTAFAKRKLLDLAFGATAYTPPAAIYAGLGTALTASTDTLTEWDDSSYTRQAAAFTAEPSGVGNCPNTHAEEFSASVDAATATLTHFGLWDDVASGNLLVTGPLNSSKTALMGDTVNLSAGGIIVTFQ